MIGFAAAFGLFLAAMKYRTMADDTTKLSLAASSIIEELAIGNGTSLAGFPAPKPPTAYLGAGDLPVTNSGVDPLTLYAYPGVPGTWYTFESCTDVLGDSGNAMTPTLHVNLLVLVFTAADPSLALDLAEVNRRVRVVAPPSAGYRGTLDAAEAVRVLDGLVKRGMAMRVSAVVLRRPAWM